MQVFLLFFIAYCLFSILIGNYCRFYWHAKTRYSYLFSANRWLGLTFYEPEFDYFLIYQMAIC